MSSRALSVTVVAIVAAGVVLTVSMGREHVRHADTAATATLTATETPGAALHDGAGVTVLGIGRHLDALQEIADRNSGTRAAGTTGDAATVAYIVASLEQAGWTVHTQALRVPVFIERSASVRARGVDARDHRVLTFSGSGDVTARVRAVAGLGCDATDYAGVRRGEVALVRRGTCLLATKARNAEAAGAGAVLIANPEERTFAGTLGAPGLGIPALAVSSGAARGLPGRLANVEVDAISKRARVRNVLAETRSARTARTVVMAGAHLDSVPEGPGINDDGSGVAALLEAAEALRDRPVRLAFWNGEELGLYGSRHYVDALSAAARARISAYVNLDMVGTPGGTARVYGSGDVDDALLNAAGGELDRTRIGASSDHAPFERAGIDAGGLYTGTHRCYHAACDTAGRVDRPLATQMTRVAVRAIEALS